MLTQIQGMGYEGGHATGAASEPKGISHRGFGCLLRRYRRRRLLLLLLLLLLLIIELRHFQW